MKMNNFHRILGFAALCLLGGAAVAADDEFVIMHDAVSHVVVGDQVSISVTIDDPHGEIELVRTYFKTSDDDRFYFVAMKKTEGNTYTALLPAPLYGVESLKYQILAKSTSDQILRTPRYFVEVEDEDKSAIAFLE